MYNMLWGWWTQELTVLCFMANLSIFPRTPAVIDGFGGKAVRVNKVQIPMGIGHLPPKEYTVYISPIPEYIFGVDILQGLWLQTTAGEFRLRVHVVMW